MPRPLARSPGIRRALHAATILAAVTGWLVPGAASARQETVDENVGRTDRETTSTICSGGIVSNDSETTDVENPGPQSAVTLFDSRQRVEDFAVSCDPASAFICDVARFVDQSILHFDAALGAPGNLQAITVLAGTAIDSGIPPGAKTVEAHIATADGGTANVTLNASSVPDGFTLAWTGIFASPVAIAASAALDIVFAASAQAPLTNVDATTIPCPPPVGPLPRVESSGVVSLVLQNVVAVLSLEDDAPGSIVVFPRYATVGTGGTREFEAYQLPNPSTGDVDVGLDGIPGTSDDPYTVVNADWITLGSIGSTAPASGPTTTFTAGSDPGTGTVQGSTGGASADAQVTVIGTPTHRLNLEVERMFRQGLPLADDADAGDTEIVVRPTTAHELNESIDTMVVGGTILPFDAGASLLGELVKCERTILALSLDLAAMRAAILGAIEASGRDPGDPRQVTRFLRRNPDQGRFTLTLDAGIDRDLTPDAGAYVGSVDAGTIGFQPDLLLREAQRPFVVTSRQGDREIQILVDLVEDPDSTNVLPYADETSPRDRNRLARAPGDGGRFQHAGQPNWAQIVAIVQGRGHRRFPVGIASVRRRSGLLYTGNVGESGPQAAHGLAHVVGHLLFGARHDRTDGTSILHPNPQPPGDSNFFESNFSDFRYGERTIRRGARHLDRYWRNE